MQTEIYNNEDKKKSMVDLPEDVFGLEWNPDLVHQVIVAMQANRRQNIAHTKTRGEVRGGGKKPWRQKGTGRARHGSIRSPIWVGGGTTFGPRNEKNFTKKINKKMRIKALLVVLSQKYRDGEVIFVDNFSQEKPSTKEARTFIENLSSAYGKDILNKKTNAACVFVGEPDKNIIKSFKNIENIETEEVRNINPFILLENKYVIFLNTGKAIEFLKERLEKLKQTKAVLA